MDTIHETAAGFGSLNNEKKQLTRAELGQVVFQAIKTDLESRGFSLWDENFDPEYPISLRAIWNIRKGHFRIETLNSLPGIKKVEEWFCFESK